jgi:hypothetical protein
MLKLVGAVGSVLVLALLLAPAAEACTCAPPTTIADALRTADAVFFGYPVVARLERRPSRNTDGAVQTQFQVLKAWKGIEAPLVWVGTSLDMRACGYGSFEIGANYLVFAHGSLDGLSVSLCGRTRPEPDTVFDVEALGRPQRTFSTSSGER